MQLKFKIEQIAICPPDPERAKALLTKLGAGPWSEDHVMAAGRVRGFGGSNEADLSFEYDMLKAANELEVLHYTDGPHWMQGVAGCVSHFGMHCTADDLHKWRKVFQDEGIAVAQEVNTFSHTNPSIKFSRRYNYVIFATRHILGVDLKFIVRLPAPQPA